MRRIARRVSFVAALGAALLAAGLAAGGCGKYGPPRRPQPTAEAAAEGTPAEDLERGEFDDGDRPGPEPSPEQVP